MRHLPLLVTIFLAVSAFDGRAAEDALSDALTLIYDDRPIDAYLSLEPLLLSEERDETHEAALWLADRLCAYIPRTHHLYTRIEPETPLDGSPEARAAYDLQEQAFIAELNRLGAEFAWDHLGGSWEYYRAFARRLVELYPEGRHSEAAAYYAIRPGYNDREDVERWLAELEEYLARFGGSRTDEVGYARRHVAGIYDSLWQLLTLDYDTDDALSFKTDDGQEDAKRAEQYRTLALGLYRDWLISHGGLDPTESSGVFERARALRRGEREHGAGLMND